MKTITYMTGLATFYLKGEISTDQNFLKMKIPNTILSLIPLGSKNDNVPVQQVASVSSDFQFNLKSFLIGVVEVLLGFGFMGDSFLLGLIFLLLGASTVITSFITLLKVSTTAGKEYVVPFLVFEKSKATQAEQLINNMISSRLNDTNNRQVVEAQTSAIIDAMNKQRQ